MSFQTGLSGLNVSSKSLDVIGNNIANSSTVGFKFSRNEFSELVAGSLGTGGSNSAGIGAATAAIAQQFNVVGSYSMQAHTAADLAVEGVALGGAAFTANNRGGALWIGMNKTAK